MKNRAVTVLSPLLLFLLALGFASPTMAASSGSSTNQTGPQGQPIELEWQDGTTLYQPNWTSSSAEFTFESQIPTTLTIVDMNSIGDSGSGDISTKTIRLSPNDPKTVQMDLGNEAGSMGVTISNGKQMKYTSNPQKPIFETIFRWMLYVGLIIGPVEVAVFTVGIIKLKKRRLKKELIQVA